MAVDEITMKRILLAQGHEISEHFIYMKLARSIKNPYNRNILEQIAEDELKHCDFWKKYTGRELKPDKLKMLTYYLISRIFGLTFGIKLLERGEGEAQVNYREIAKVLPAAMSIVEDEDKHEKDLINMIDEERLKYVGSMILGLNDALVELTGALAGFTFALQNSKMIALIGLITGISASFSMAASEYLATKSTENDKHPLKASAYTGCAYISTVLILILPFFFITNFYLALGCTLICSIIVIFLFTFYISIAGNLSFKRRFIEMAVLSLGVSAISFCIGLFVRTFIE